MLKLWISTTGRDCHCWAEEVLLKDANKAEAQEGQKTKGIQGADKRSQCPLPVPAFPSSPCPLMAEFNRCITELHLAES